MAEITVNGLTPEEESYLRDIAEEYSAPQFLDFQDIPAVSMMARGVIRLLNRLTVKPGTQKAGTKVKFLQ